MGKVNIDHLRLWVEDYYRRQLKTSRIDDRDVKFYTSLRGYYKTGNSLDEVQLENFLPTDYILWSALIKNLKKGHDVVLSGGCFFRYKDYKGYSGETAFYKSRNKFVELGLLIETPFRAYYIVNPKYVIKVYINKKIKE